MAFVQIEPMVGNASAATFKSCRQAVAELI